MASASVPLSVGSNWCSHFSHARTFETYPQGAVRWWMIALTVIAQVIVYYEFQLGPILPLLLPYLHMSPIAYGHFLSFVLVLSVITAFYGGPLADRYGRVIIIEACLSVMIVLTFLNLTITNIWSFIVIRSLMAANGGLIVASLFGLTRDMTPRANRALGFGLIVVGALACNWLANFVAGLTLPIYHTWQSQIWILAIFASVMYFPIVFGLKDLSPALRMEIRQNELTTLESRLSEKGEVTLPRGTLAAYGALLRHVNVALLAVTCVLFSTLNLFMQAYGPLMFTKLFKYDPAKAARLTAYLWTSGALGLVVFGWLSDRFQIRKPLVQIGTLGMVVVLAWWVPTFAHPRSYGVNVAVCIALGALYAVTMSAFCAFYSVAVENISPALQATGWSLFHSVARSWNAIASSLLILIAVRVGWSEPIWICAAGAGSLCLAILPLKGR